MMLPSRKTGKRKILEVAVEEEVGSIVVGGEEGVAVVVEASDEVVCNESAFIQHTLSIVSVLIKCGLASC